MGKSSRTVVVVPKRVLVSIDEEGAFGLEYLPDAGLITFSHGDVTRTLPLAEFLDILSDVGCIVAPNRGTIGSEWVVNGKV